MAGSLQLVTEATESLGRSTTSTIGRWEVQFSTFIIPRSSPPSRCPLLVPLCSDPRKKHPAPGTWLSAASPASLQLLDSGDVDGGHGAILTVSLGEMIIEEHCIAKLRFTWPHVSCMSGFPARGSRAIFVSYRDHDDAVQKFALRFPTNCEVEAFTNALLESLYGPNNAAEIGLPSPPIASEMSSHSEIVPSSTPPHRCKEQMDAASPAEKEAGAMLCGNKTETMDNHDDAVSLEDYYPPSFTSLLTSCQDEAEKAAAQCTSSQDEYLRSQIMMYMEDSAFQEMLISVEKVIGELPDLALQAPKPSESTSIQSRDK